MNSNKEFITLKCKNIGKNIINLNGGYTNVSVNNPIDKIIDFRSVYNEIICVNIN